MQAARQRQPEIRELDNQRPFRVYSPSYLSFVWVSIQLISGFAPVAAADQNMAPVSTSAIISDHLEIITFLCGSLSAREKKQLTDEIEREISKDPRRGKLKKGSVGFKLSSRAAAAIACDLLRDELCIVADPIDQTRLGVVQPG